MLKTKPAVLVCAVSLLLGLPLVTTADEASTASTLRIDAEASSLLSVDQNRATIVERILGEWGDRIAAMNPGLSRAQLRDALFALRSDQLLSASLAGSTDGLLDVVEHAVVAATQKGAGQTKALGDPGVDLAYVPLTPCRLVDTRAVFPAVYQGAGPFNPGEIRTYTVQSGNGVCSSQLPPGTSLSAVQVQVFGIPRNGVSGDIEVIPPGVAFGSTATLVFLGTNAFTSAGTTVRVDAAKQFRVQVRQGIADIAIDIVGYFRVPSPVVQKQTFAYTLPPGAVSPPMPIPVADAPVSVQAANLTIGSRGVSQVSVLRVTAAPTFLEWTGLSSTSGSAIVQGFSGVAGTLINQIDFSHVVRLEVHDATSMQVHNTSTTTTHFGVVTITW